MTYHRYRKSGAGQEGTLVLKDLEASIHQRLGDEYDRKRLAAIKVEYRAFQHEKRALDHAVMSGEISGRVFANRTNKLATKYFQRIGKILGSIDYERVFGKPIDEPWTVMDPNVAARTVYRH